MTYSAVILAGGKSSRMKMNKALIEVNGKTFIEIIGKELEKEFDEVIVITNTPEEYEFLPYELYKDIYPQKGPLAGIHSGLKHCKNKYAFFTACDMPLINSSLAKKLCEMTEDKYDCVVPKKGEYLQPLFAVYSKPCIPYIEKCIIEDKYRIISFYPYVNILFPQWDKLINNLDEKTFFNINTPQDLEIFKKIMDK